MYGEMLALSMSLVGQYVSLGGHCHMHTHLCHIAVHMYQCINALSTQL